MELKGKSVLITGGSTGIGLEAAKQFLAKGAQVIITGRNEAKLDAAKRLYPALITIKSDVADQADAQALVEKIKKLGGIDILYNNAGVGSSPKNLGKPSVQHYQDALYEMNVNYLGVIRLTDLFLDLLNSRAEAAIINTTSILSYVPNLLAPTYSASKVALRFYTEELRRHLEIAGSRLKVFELLPPLVDTEMAAGFDEEKLPTETLIKALLDGMAKDQFTIRVGLTKKLYLMSRLFPKVAFNLLNARKLQSYLN
jgi:uncharacterized oxidoreductase